MGKPALMIAASHSGAGKTTVTTGLLHLLGSLGLSVQSYKIGPDFIDAGHHAELTGKPCVNLDRFLLVPPGEEKNSPEILRRHFKETSADADIRIVEAVGGFYDDWYHDGNSPAEIAKILDIPVMLVLDGSSSCQTLGIMARALVDADVEIRIAALLFTRVSGETHFLRIREGIGPGEGDELYCSWIPYDKRLFLEERHLGLVTAGEIADGSERDERARVYTEIFSKQVDVKRLFGAEISGGGSTEGPRRRPPSGVRSPVVAVARDRAFSFYYEYNLRLIEKAGGNIVYFSPLEDKKLPRGTRLVYIGGGFPELFAEGLAANGSLLEDLRRGAQGGVKFYGECGGLMYLGKTMEDSRHRSYETAGLLPYDTVFTDKLVISYAECSLTAECILGKRGTLMRGHVFHRSAIKDRTALTSVCEARIPGQDTVFQEGFIAPGIYVSYVHLHFASNPEIPFTLLRD